jgi:hypothetical protein
MNLIETYQILYSASPACIFFLTIHRTFARVDYISNCKTSLSELKKIETKSGNP